MQFQKISIIGVGLLGGSIGLAVKRRKLAREVAGYVRRAVSFRRLTASPMEPPSKPTPMMEIF